MALSFRPSIPRSNGEMTVAAGTKSRGRARTATGAAKESDRSEAGRALRLLLRYSASQRRALIMAIVALAIESATAVYEPVPLAYFIDYLRAEFDGKGNVEALPVPGIDGTVLGFHYEWPRSLQLFQSPRISTIVFLTTAFVLLAIINALADSSAQINFAKGGRALGYNLRVALYSHLQRLSLAFHNKSRTGDVLARVTGDVTVVEDFVTERVTDLIYSVMLLIGISLFLLFQSWEMAILAAIIVPVLSLVSNFFSRRIKSASKRQRSSEGDLASAAQEMLTSIRVIQTYGRGGYEQQRFAEQSSRALRAALDSTRLEAFFGLAVRLVEAGATIGVVWLSFYLIEGGTLTVGRFVLFTFLIDRMFKPTRRVIKEWSTIGKIFASIERIADLLNRKPSVVDLPGAVPAPPFRGQVEFRNVSFAYQSDGQSSDGRDSSLRLALNDVSFTASTGEVVALVGPSGAGKSTVLQLLPRLYDPHAGGVLIDGTDIRSFTLSSLRAQLSMVLQETVLFSGTVAYNIAYGGNNVTSDDIVEAAMQANAHEFIEKMPDGYNTELGERASNLSGGQRQRIAIARALVRNSPILLLDEPTTGLDAESTDLVLQALQRLMRGKTTIIISHDLNLVRAADRILVVRQGQIVEEGRHDQLLARDGLYASLYARQFGPVAPEPALVGAPSVEEDEDDELDKVFQTMLLEALPRPVDRRVYEHTMHGKSPVGAHDGPGAEQRARAPRRTGFWRRPQ
jgi:ABC-type multidrug transport system fused ATPase/permease subunit